MATACSPTLICHCKANLSSQVARLPTLSTYNSVYPICCIINCTVSMHAQTRAVYFIYSCWQKALQLYTCIKHISSTIYMRFCVGMEIRQLNNERGNRKEFKRQLVLAVANKKRKNVKKGWKWIQENLVALGTVSVQCAKMTKIVETNKKTVPLL